MVPETTLDLRHEWRDSSLRTIVRLLMDQSKTLMRLRDGVFDKSLSVLRAMILIKIDIFRLITPRSKLFDISGMERNASMVGVLQRFMVGFAMPVHRVWPTRGRLIHNP